jgi:AraC-like DNA-binding protein
MERPKGLPDSFVTICGSGRGWLRIGGSEHLVEPGTAIVVPAHVPHSHRTEDPPWEVWAVLLRGSDVAELLGALGASIQRPLVRVRSLGRAIAMIDELLAGFDHPSMAQVVESSGLAWRLLSFMAVDRLRPEPEDPVEAVMAYVRDHFADRLDVRQIAADAGLSVSRLLARFHDATGGGVIAFQIQLRMTRAAQLLDTTTTTIAEIARLVGYDDAYYFARRFQRSHGMSPSEFRQRPRM